MRPLSVAGHTAWAPEGGEELFGTWRGLFMYLGVSRAPGGAGSLHITAQRCVWIPDGDASTPADTADAPPCTTAAGPPRAYEIRWDDVSAHGTPQAGATFPQPQLWLMLDRDLEAEAPEGQEAWDTTNEARFMPVQLDGCDEILAALFDAFSRAACGMPNDDAAPADAARPVGDFGRKRKRAAMEAPDGTAAVAAFEQLQRLEDFDFAAMVPGSALSPEEYERKLAEWDSKLIVLDEDGDVDDGDHDEA